MTRILQTGSKLSTLLLPEGLVELQLKQNVILQIDGEGEMEINTQYIFMIINFNEWELSYLKITR